jgi:hypothetical protein
MIEKRANSRFSWEATIKPDVSPQKTEVRWYRRDTEEEQYSQAGAARSHRAECRS